MHNKILYVKLILDKIIDAKEILNELFTRLGNCMLPGERIQ
jgi:hypothetical protein